MINNDETWIELSKCFTGLRLLPSDDGARGVDMDVNMRQRHDCAQLQSHLW